MEDWLVLGQRLDWVILEVSSNLDDSVIEFRSQSWHAAVPCNIA